MNVYDESKKNERRGCILQMIIDFKRRREQAVENLKMVETYDLWGLKPHYKRRIEIVDRCIQRLTKKYQSELKAN